MSTLNTSAPAISAELAGSWKLAPRRAVTLAPRADGVLRIARGVVWATVDGPHGAGRGTESGDHQLVPGRTLALRAGQRVVLESWHSDRAAHFSWDPVSVDAASPALRVDLAALAQPLRELRVAGALAGHALGALVVGVGRLVIGLVRPRGPLAAAR